MIKIKRKNLIIGLIILEIIILLLVFNTYINKHKYKITNEVRFKEQQIDHSTFALLKEVNGEYVESNGSTWPTLPDYKFNSELSGCIDLNGEAVDNALSFNEGVMSLRTNKSIKCYVYFSQTYKVSINGETLGYLEDELVDLSEYVPNPTTRTVSIANNVDGATMNPNTNSFTISFGFTGTDLSSNAVYGVTTNPTNSWDGTSVNATYFKNLGTKGSTVTINGSYNTVTLPTVTKEGYGCGYTTSNPGTEIKYKSGSSYTGNSNSLYVYCKSLPTLQEIIEELSTEGLQKNGDNEDWAVVQEDGYRYEGKNPDNYLIMCPVDNLNCTCGEGTITNTKAPNTSDYETYQSSDECEYAWRIIGMFPDGTDGSNVIRIVKNKWETQKYNNDWSTNHWPDSTLYSSWSNTYSVGENNNYPKAIEYNVYLGTSSRYDSYTSTQLYQMERGGSVGPTSEATANASVNVGLIYPSDYGYGVLAGGCVRTKKTDKYYDQEDCYKKNWLYQGSSVNQWSISPSTLAVYMSFIVTKSGGLNGNDYTMTSYAARPVLSLKASQIVGGSGTPGDPYELN